MCENAPARPSPGGWVAVMYQAATAHESNQLAFLASSDRSRPQTGPPSGHADLLLRASRSVTRELFL